MMIVTALCLFGLSLTDYTVVNISQPLQCLQTIYKFRVHLDSWSKQLLWVNYEEWCQGRENCA